MVFLILIMGTHTGTRTGVCTVSELPQNTQKKFLMNLEKLGTLENREYLHLNFPKGSPEGLIKF